MIRAGIDRFARSDDEETPVGINVAMGAAAIAAATLCAARLPSAELGWRCVVVAAVIAAFAALTKDGAALALLVIPAWMIMNGFLVNRSGDLSWHGSADLYRFLQLTAAGGFGLVIGQVAGRVHEVRERWQLGAVTAVMSMEFDKETHRA